MNCPLCGADTRVRDTREPPLRAWVLRRRECRNGHRFTTRETHFPRLIAEQTKRRGELR